MVSQIYTNYALSTIKSKLLTYRNCVAYNNLIRSYCDINYYNRCSKFITSKCKPRMPIVSAILDIRYFGTIVYADSNDNTPNTKTRTKRTTKAKSTLSTNVTNINIEYDDDQHTSSNIVYNSHSSSNVNGTNTEDFEYVEISKPTSTSTTKANTNAAKASSSIPTEAVNENTILWSEHGPPKDNIAIHELNITQAKPPKPSSAPKSTVLTTSKLKSASRKPLKPLMLFASEVASIVGLSSWRPFPETFESIWSRNDPNSYNNAKDIVSKIESRIILTREQEIEQIVAPTSVKPLIDILLPLVSQMDPVEFQSVEQLLTHSVKLNIDSQYQTLVLNNELSKLRKQIGILNESKAISTIERVTKRPVMDSNKQFYSKTMGKCIYQIQYNYNSQQLYNNLSQWARGYNKNIDDYDINFNINQSYHLYLHRDWLVGGKIDGFHSGQLIEIKNRTRTFLNPIPFYERAQMEVYLQVLDINEGILIERIQLKENKEDTRSTVLKRDNNVWDRTLIPRLSKFTNYLHTFLLQPARQIEFIKAKTDADKAILIADIIPTPLSGKK